MDTEAFFDEGYSENTRRAYRADWRQFRGWCERNGRVALPAEPETIAGYVDSVTDVYKPATITRRVGTVGIVHKHAGLANPARTRAVEIALKRMHRKRGRRQGQALAITFERRQQMLSAVGGRRLKMLRDKALLSTAYDVGCRRSELVSIRIEDLDRAADGSATVLLRKTKTDQEGSGSVKYIAPDTLANIDAWLDAAGIEDGPLFRSVRASGKIGPSLWDGAVSRIFKQLSALAGHEADAVKATSGHSTRVGMAQDMAAAGIDLASIMQAGSWKTPTMVARYIERLAAKNGAAAKLASLQGRHRV